MEEDRQGATTMTKCGILPSSNDGIDSIINTVTRGGDWMGVDVDNIELPKI